MGYEINEKQFKIAERLGVEIKPSENTRKKIDVYKNNEFLFSIGAINFPDLFSLIETEGVQEALS